MTLTESERILHACETKLPMTRLVVKEHFDKLTTEEKLYVHWIGKASWAGARVIMGQTTDYAADLVDMFLNLFSNIKENEKDKSTIRNVAALKTASGPDLFSNIKENEKDKSTIRNVAALKTASGLSDETWSLFLEYAVSVLYNLSNYLAFGDSKFVPNISEEDFAKVFAAAERPVALELYKKHKDKIFNLGNKSENFLGFPSEGHISGYYSGNPIKEEIEAVSKFLQSKNILELNTRLFKTGEKTFEVRIAAAHPKPTVDHTTEDGTKISLVYGDFKDAMKRAGLMIRRAIFCTEEKTRQDMCLKYAESWEKGDIEAHKESQRLWVSDKGPAVECNVGFVETYKDPACVRAEWEGFVAVVNKEQTEKFANLVENAEKFLGLLPWPRQFEKEKFHRPDFTALEVVQFATGGGPPLGINIPNYDDIRQTVGFKNVSLSNIANTPTAANEVVNFVHPDDLEKFNKFKGPAFEVQVGLHELLGHGSGKLFTETEAGVFNFKADEVINPLTKEKITSYYKVGQTWGSQFGSVASSYEECRAETIAMVLMDNEEILNIFHVKGEDRDALIEVSFLTMARAGVMGLLVYDPKAKKWGQAHSQARFGILQAFIAAGIATVTPTNNACDDFHVRVLPAAELKAKGLPALRDFLLHLQVYKSTGDATAGVPWYIEKTSVSDDWLKFRETVIKKKQPRKVFVQGNTYIEKGTAVLKEYPTTYEGFIESVIERDL